MLKKPLSIRVRYPRLKNKIQGTKSPSKNLHSENFPFSDITLPFMPVSESEPLLPQNEEIISL